MDVTLPTTKMPKTAIAGSFARTGAQAQGATYLDFSDVASSVSAPRSRDRLFWVSPRQKLATPQSRHAPSRGLAGLSASASGFNASCTSLRLPVAASRNEVTVTDTVTYKQ